MFGISVGITGSVVGLKICAITTGFTKKGQKHDTRVWLAKAKLNST